MKALRIVRGRAFFQAALPAARAAIATLRSSGVAGLLGLLATLSMPAAAHEMTMAEMDVRETAPGEFLWQWSATNERAPGDVLTPTWPASCQADGNRLSCGEAGLRGTLSVDGVGRKYSAAIVRITWRDGASRVFTLTGSQPEVKLFGGADDRRGLTEIASAYVMLGVEHILGGIDHLMFVVSLLFLVGVRRRLFWTITAFTLAHSLTLALSVLEVLALRQPPVEATIALSIMLVAGEALHDRGTVARRWPALVAFLFGLVHGLGFASALKDVGLPSDNLWVALLTFNVGVELGQLGVVALAIGLYRFASRWRGAVLLRMPALYAIGAVAAYWSIGRIAAIVA